MKNKSSSGAKNMKAFTLGRKMFAQISAVEGIHMSTAMKADFRAFDKNALPAKKRRQILVGKYGKTV